MIPTPRVSTFMGARETASYLDETWLESESLAYPNGGFTRRAYVKVRANPHNPIEAWPVDTMRLVRCSVPDTFSTIPARMTFKGKRMRGYVSVIDDVFTFTPEASPERCTVCTDGEGCKK